MTKPNGYWLFDRNDVQIKKGEGCRKTVGDTEMVVAKRDYPAIELSLTSPWAIYKWVSNG